MAEYLLFKKLEHILPLKASRFIKKLTLRNIDPWKSFMGVCHWDFEGPVNYEDQAIEIYFKNRKLTYLNDEEFILVIRIMFETGLPGTLLGVCRGIEEGKLYADSFSFLIQISEEEYKRQCQEPGFNGWIMIENYDD